MFLAFPGQEPGLLKEPSYVCPESVSKLTDALDSSAPPGGGTSLRSLEDTRVGLAGIEARKAFADVCVLCGRVHGLQAAHGPGPVQARTQHVCMRSKRAFQGPFALCGAVLPGFPEGRSIAPPSSFASCDLGQSRSLGGTSPAIASLHFLA